MAGIQEFISKVSRKFSRGRDFAIDLGTKNLIIAEHGAGVVVNEPSVVAVDTVTRAVKAAGSEAATMLDRTGSDVQARRPMKEGTINDLELAKKMLRYFMEEVTDTRFRALSAPSNWAIIGVPVDTDDVHKNAYFELGAYAGIGETELTDEVFAAAIGSGLKVSEPKGRMVVDIGGGTTDIAIISNGAIVVKKKVRVAGDAMDRSIRDFIRKNKDLDISLAQAEQIKKQCGGAIPLEDQEPMEITGQDLQKRRPSRREVTPDDIAEALKPPVNEIINNILGTLELTPPALAEDVYRDGVRLAGGGSKLQGLDQRVEDLTELPVSCVKDPDNAVIKGLEIMMDQHVNSR